MSLSLHSFAGKRCTTTCARRYEQFRFWLLCCGCLPRLRRNNRGSRWGRTAARCAAWPSIPKIQTAFFSAPAPALSIFPPTKEQTGRALPGRAIPQKWCWITSLSIPPIHATCSLLRGMRRYRTAMAIFSAAKMRARPGRSSLTCMANLSVR